MSTTNVSPDNAQQSNYLSNPSLLSSESINPKTLPFSDQVTNFAKQTGLYPTHLFLSLINQKESNDGIDSNSQEKTILLAKKFGEFLQANLQSVRNWDDFEKGWDKFSESENLQSEKELYEGFLKDFSSMMKIKLNDRNELTEGDWTILNGGKEPLNFANPSGKNNPFVMAFNHFLKIYQPNSQEKNPLNITTDFIGNFQNFVELSSVTPLKEYKAFYDKTVKGHTPEDFKAHINKFYEDQVQNNEYFLPSHAFADWTSFVRTMEANASMQGTLPNQQTAAASSVEQTATLEETASINDIIELLMEMVRVLQELAIAQANRLTFYTDYQNAYTVLQSQVPYLEAGAIGPEDEQEDQKWVTARNDFNQNVANTLNQNLQAQRGIQEDNASKQQTYLNTTTQAVNDTINQMNAFMDLLGRIRDVIFR